MTKSSQKLQGSSTPHVATDSAELDIRVMADRSSSGKKPWLTVLMEPQTARVKGLVWTTDCPSRNSEARLAVDRYTRILAQQNTEKSAGPHSTV